MRLRSRIATKVIITFGITKYVALLRYFRAFHRWPSLSNPQDLNEKILWLMTKTDTSLWTRLADKYGVREYVKSHGLEHILVKLYGVYTNPDDIDLDTLPSKFIVKANNGYGTVMAVPDKTALNPDEFKAMLHKWLREPFGYLSGEYHYTLIKPCIIIEQLLEPDKNLSDSLVDYKIWCFNGKADTCLVCVDRDPVTHVPSLSSYTLPDWNHRPQVVRKINSTDRRIPKPRCLDKMIEYAEILSAGIPQVRVDFYEVDGKVYFGEMTFTANCGRIQYYTPDELLRMGALITLPADKPTRG